ncbi:HDOD domain-containing protein [bacterium]|nr:HDOD domain-containing protein [bacterium]
MDRPFITRETLKDTIASHPGFASVPKLAVPIITMANDDRTSLTDLAKLIEMDPEFSARILEIANSSAYGFRRKITSISHAVVLLGWNAIKMLALGSTILSQMSTRNHRLFSHCTQTAQIARFLAQEANFYKIEEIAVVGLLHDIGAFILEMYFPNEYLKARQYAIDHSVPIFVGERELFDIDHADVGGWTLEEWKLPENISDSVAKHHRFDPAHYHARKTAVIHVADVLALAVNYSGPPWEKIHGMSEKALDILGFTNTELRDMVLTIMNMKLKPLII